MGKGKTYENSLVNDINDDDGTVDAWPLGFSGNHATIDADILLTTARQNYLVEAKVSGGERCYVDQDQLERLVAGENPYTSAVLHVNFANRRPVTVRYFDSFQSPNVPDDYGDWSVPEKFAFLFGDEFDANVTPSGRLSVSKPSLDEWQSAQASGEPYACLLSDLGLPNEYSEQIEEPALAVDS